jgi:hypothetical protein
MTPAQKRAETIRARKASDARIAQAQAETQAVVDAGSCPQCGAGVHRNWAITGWFQCDQYGSDGFRKDDAKPACSWQGFVC